MDKSQINSRTIEVINTLLNKIPELTKTALADTLKVKPAKFSEILNGRMNAGTDLMALLCSKYSVSPEYILMGEGIYLKTNSPQSQYQNTMIPIQIIKITIMRPSNKKVPSIFYCL